MKAFSRILLPIAVVVLLFLSNCFFVVNQWESAVRFQFGKIIEVHKTPGLHFKMPIIQDIVKFDNRIQTLETRPERFLTLEKKNLIVDTFVKWRIVEPAVFYQRVQGSPVRLNNLLDPIIKNSYRAEFGKKNLQEVVAGFNEDTMRTTREDIQQGILLATQIEGRKAGVEIVDVRIKGVELPNDVTESVFERMRTERERAAKDFRARGESSYIETVANADKTRAVMLANAYGQAEQYRGQGDAQAADIYAAAYGKNAEFYQFFRSLEAYRHALKGNGDMLILDTNSEFFKYFYPK